MLKIQDLWFCSSNKAQGETRLHNQLIIQLYINTGVKVDTQSTKVTILYKKKCINIKKGEASMVGDDATRTSES